MPRLIALILMLIVPLQFAWSAVVGVHGHAGDELPALGMHSHAHDHGHGHEGSAHGDPVASPEGSTNSTHGDDGHHASHYHPVFTSIPVAIEVSLGMTSPGEPIRHPPAVFFSRTPPPLDRPPLALA